MTASLNKAVLGKRCLCTTVVYLAITLTSCGNDSLTCKERREGAYETIDQAIAQNLSCTTSADCTQIALDTDCGGRCPAAVAQSGVTVVQQAINDANDEFCGGYGEAGCAIVRLKKSN